MKNPVNNFGDNPDISLTGKAKEQFEFEQAFHLETYDFDLEEDYPATYKIVGADGQGVLSSDDVAAFNKKVTGDPPNFDKMVKDITDSIDKIYGNDVRP